MALDTWEDRRLALTIHRKEKMARHKTFEQAYAAAESDYGMDGYAIVDFMDWLQDSYKRWPFETLAYIIALTMNDEKALRDLDDRAHTNFKAILAVEETENG